MKKIKLYFSLFLFAAIFACNNEAFLEMPESTKFNCNTVYDELSHIRIDKIGKARYKYAMVDGAERLVEIIDSASYTTSYYDYQNGQLFAKRGFDRLQEASNSYQEFSYSDGLMDKVSHYLYWQKEGATDGLSELGGYSIFSRNEMGQVVESMHYTIEDGQEVLNSILELEWDDCNLIQLQSFDKNKTLGYTTTFFYDDKVNPYGLTKVAKTSAWLSTNNKVRSETIVTNDPDYLFDLLIDSGTSENTYTYNEFGLPIQRRFNEFDKVDYFYTID